MSHAKSTRSSKSPLKHLIESLDIYRNIVQLELYGMGRHTTAHLYAVPVLEGFDAVRNCSHCRRSTDDDCKAWRKLRKSVAVLRQECRWYAKGVDELPEATGAGRR